MKNLTGLSLVILFLAACNPPQPLPAATETDTKTPYLSPTPTLRPTRTPGPTRTRPSTPSITPTSIYPTRQPQPSWTPDLVNIIDWPIQPNCIQSKQVSRTDISPDNQWLVLHECYDPDSTLVVSNHEGTKTWNLHYVDYTNHTEDGLIEFETWSHDSTYMYFYTTGYFDPIGCFYIKGGWGLFRLNVLTGETSAVLPLQSPDYPYSWYIWSFSPTGRRLIFTTANSPLQFLDLKSGLITSVPPLADHIDLGGFRWSPDGLSVAFTMRQQGSDGAETFILNLIDLNTDSVKTLLKSYPNQCLVASYWLNEKRLVVYTVPTYSDEKGTELEIDIPSVP